VKPEIEKARKARRALEKTGLRLIRPTVQSMDSSVSDLKTAVDCLGRLEHDLRSKDKRDPGWQSLEQEVAGMRRELKRVNALLAGAGHFLAGWARLLVKTGDDAQANYTPAGKAGAPIPIDSAKVVMHG
jgi:hypothetical protein